MSALSYYARMLSGILILSSSMIAQETESIPRNATILETRSLSAKRKLILWMPDPKKNPYEEADDIYSCFDQTRGSYYTGEVRVTLIDPQKNKTINTLKVKGDDRYEGYDTIDIPYLIRSGYYYKVPNRSSKIERKPQIMSLKDFNGDGRAQEFVLFNKEACVGLGTTLIGYSERRDRVIQYPIAIKAPEGSRTQFWLDYLFSKKAIRHGYWNYRVDYRGRNGTLDKYVVQYDKSRERFTASVSSQR